MGFMSGRDAPKRCLKGEDVEETEPWTMFPIKSRGRSERTALLDGALHRLTSWLNIMQQKVNVYPKPGACCPELYSARVSGLIVHLYSAVSGFLLSACQRESLCFPSNSWLIKIHTHLQMLCRGLTSDPYSHLSSLYEMGRRERVEARCSSWRVSQFYQNSWNHILQFVLYFKCCLFYLLEVDSQLNSVDLV